MTQSVRADRERWGRVKRRSELYLSSPPMDKHARAFIKGNVTAQNTSRAPPHARQCYYSYEYRTLMVLQDRGWTCFARLAEGLRTQGIINEME